jgi:hypothetical protein
MGVPMTRLTGSKAGADTRQLGAPALPRGYIIMITTAQLVAPSRQSGGLATQ